MTDYISREAALHALCEAVHSDDGCVPCRNQLVSCRWTGTRTQEYAERILAIPAADVRSVRWIPVTERLPEKMQYVLVRYKNNDMAVASWFDGDEDIRFWRAMTDEGWCADCDTEPTHWMPLPEPPKKEAENDRNL